VLTQPSPLEPPIAPFLPKNSFEVQIFHHGPPSLVHGRWHWPPAPDFPSSSSIPSLAISDVYFHISPFLDETICRVIRCALADLQSGVIGTPLWYDRYRLWGSSMSTLGCSTHHNVADRFAVLPYAWTFLDPPTRGTCLHVCTSWRSYISLQIDACRLSVAPLRALCLIPSSTPSVKLSKARAHLYAYAIFRFFFVCCGDFICWLNGKFTNRFTATRPLSANYPAPDYPRTIRICTEGVPLRGDLITPASQIPRRDVYNNHPVVETNSDGVESKFVKEEEKSFHIHFPRFLIWFLPGLVLAPLQRVTRKGKGRICVDCTNGPDVAGSANISIPKPNIANAHECPPVFYQHSFTRHLRRLWRTRLTHPKDEILQHCDDVDAAFRRVLYPPDLAIIFAYMFLVTMAKSLDLDRLRLSSVCSLICEHLSLPRMIL
jgi:hypothetical protein